MSSCVYFIQGHGGGPIKIGVTSDLRRRLHDLQIGSPVPLVVLVDIPGDVAVEERIHARFAPGRLHGEWFAAETPGLAVLLGNLLRDETPEWVNGTVEYEIDPIVCRCGFHVEEELADRGDRQCVSCKKGPLAK